MWFTSSPCRRDDGIRQRLKARRAFTAVEGLIALGLVAVITGLTIPVYRTYQIRSDLDNATDQTVQLLRRAQTLAQSGENDAAFGVYVQEGTLFQGDAYVLRDPSYDEVYDIPSTIDASGLDEVVFSRLGGIPSDTGIIRLTALNGQYREITVDDNGVVTISNILSDVIPSGTTGGDTSEDGGSPSGDASGDGGSSTSSAGSQSSSTGQNSSGSTGSSSSVGSSQGASSSSAGSTSSSSSAGSQSSSTGQHSSGSTGSSSSSQSDDDDTDAEDTCGIGFELSGDRVETVGTNDITLRVLGAQITYGAGGPSVDVRVSVSLDNGRSWTDLYGGNPVRGGETYTIANVPQGTPLTIRVNGRYSWLFNKTYQSDDGSGHFEVLRDGDNPPDYAPFDHQQSLASFLRGILGSNGRIDIGPRDVVFLGELGELNSSSSDFQDAVVLATFTQKATTCNSPNEPRLKVSFNRLENSGQGNAAAKVFAGPQAIAFNEEQWIPLTQNGQIIIDGGINEVVPGLAIERGAGWVRVLNHGSLPSGSHKEIIDARLLFNKAYITSIVNDSGGNASENPTDGIVNDGTSGDEFVDGPNEKSMEFKTRVTTDDDAVILYWTQGNPPNNGQQNDEPTPEEPSDEPSDDTPEEDACAVPFTVDDDGVLTLGAAADLSVVVRGSKSTYGYLGPEVQVRMQISTDGGSTYAPLYNYRRIRAGDLAVLRNVAAGSRIKIRFEGRYSWLFRRTVTSGDGDASVAVRLDGESAPDVPLVQGRTTLSSFLRSILDNQSDISIGGREAAYLVELGDLDGTADYEDAVVIISVDKPAAQGGCGGLSGTTGDTGIDDGEEEPVEEEPSVGYDPDGDEDGDGVNNRDDICAGTYMPENVPTEYMLFNRYALTKRSGVFRVGPREKISEFRLDDTRGCSCGQILDAIDGTGDNRFDEYPTLLRRLRGLFSYYVSSSRQFGCSTSLMRMVESGF